MFSAPLYNALSLQVPRFEIKEQRSITTEDSGDIGSRSDNSKSVELCPVFDKLNSALYYLCAIEKSQKRTAAERAAHMSVVLITIKF